MEDATIGLKAVSKMAVKLFKKRTEQASDLLAGVKGRMTAINEEVPADSFDQASLSALEDDCAAQAAFLGRSRARAEKAWERAKAGKYGICEVCNKPIPDERLEAVLEATCCVGCLAD